MSVPGEAAKPHGAENYDFLLSSRTAPRWKRFRAQRRAGILFPLFSLHSASSAGVGEFADLPKLAAWCRKTGLSIVQLLPLNDIGTDFRPYDASSSFALEPMHLSLEAVEGVPAASAQELRRRFPVAGRRFFDTGIKRAKLELLRRVFDRRKTGEAGFEAFKKREAAWLDAYAQFKVLKARFGGAAWESWPEMYRDRSAAALAGLAGEAAPELEFEKWLQWHASVQLEEARRETNRQGVFLVGDLPFLVSRDSADVWAERALFKLKKASGAPPDLYFADGQAWGMPPHDWLEQERTDFSYLRRKIQYAARFYDAFRIDHFVGLFRVWTFDRRADGSASKETGAFDPPDETLWEPQGRKILDALIESADLLPCAEDLGVVPVCSERVLLDYGIPGMDIQRWTRWWEKDKEWKKPQEYRPNAISMLSTHDMAPLELWWKDEMTDNEERAQFLRLTGLTAGRMSKKFVHSCLRTCLQTASILSIQLFQDWFSLEEPGSLEQSDRVNFPGLIKEENWRYLSRYSLEQMQQLNSNSTIKRLLSETNRLP